MGTVILILCRHGNHYSIQIYNSISNYALMTYVYMFVHVDINYFTIDIGSYVTMHAILSIFYQLIPVNLRQNLYWSFQYSQYQQPQNNRCFKIVITTKVEYTS